MASIEPFLAPSYRLEAQLSNQGEETFRGLASAIIADRWSVFWLKYNGSGIIY